MLMLLLQLMRSVVAHCVAAVNCHEQFTHLSWFLAYQNFYISL
jgi:hypothetical protein